MPRTESKVDMACTNPAQDEQAREEREDEELDGLAHEVGRVDVSDEAGEEALARTGTDGEGRRRRKLEAGEAAREEEGQP